MLAGNLAESILAGLQNDSVCNMVLGEPVNVRGVTLIPVISISAACGGINKFNGIMGGGVRMDPVAIVTLMESAVEIYRLQNVQDIERITSELVQNLPKRTMEIKPI